MIREFLSRHAFLRRALLILVVCACFRVVVLELKAAREFRQVMEWPRTDAVVHSASVYETTYSWTERATRFCPTFEYNYSAAGRTYTSYNRVFDFTCWPDAHGFVAKHPAGTSIQIAYDPANPVITVVPTVVQDPGYPWFDTIGGTVLLIVLVLDLFRREGEMLREEVGRSQE